MRVALLALAVVAVAGALLFLPLPFEVRTRIHNGTLIARPPAEVFAYVTTPGNWPRWHPSSLGVTGATDHPLMPGERCTEDFLVAGRRGQAVWTVTARQEARRWVIEAEVRGRPAGSVTYLLSAEGAGTRFDRELAYRAPNLFFLLLDRLALRSRVEAESAEAVRRLRAVLEGQPG